MTNERPKAGEIYRHFKGNLYQIVTIARHSQTGEELVIYQALYGTYRVYARPLEQFAGEVDRDKYPDISQRLRFERVNLQEERDHEKATEDHVKSAEDHEKAAGNHEGTREESQEEPAPCGAKEKRDETGNDSQEDQASPELLRFLDAETYDEKYKVLKSMENTITDRLINDFAVILDVVIRDGDLTHRYEELKQCVATMARYESTRLR